MTFQHLTLDREDGLAVLRLASGKTNPLSVALVEELHRALDLVESEPESRALVLSGGDPANRPDLFELIRHGKSRGLRMATIPAATERLTRELVQGLKDAGLDQMAVSIDFRRAELHDGFRGVPGAFERTMQAVRWAHEVGLPLQVNTTVCGDTAPYLEEMAPRPPSARPARAGPRRGPPSARRRW